jgi:HAD superfamily hydrolase (TIGR01509 family)
MILADRLTVPDGTAALLFDMDGVLLDTLAMDEELVNRLVGGHGHADVRVPRSVIRAHFPHHLPEFWQRVLSDVGLVLPDAEVATLVAEHERERRETSARVHDGVVDILRAARGAGLGVAVVSNNPVADVESMLSGAGLRALIDVVVGNDLPGVAPKPAPDVYLRAARELAAAPGACVAIEDSLLGAESASRAGCYTVGVATGASDFDELAASEHVSRTYGGFDTTRVELGAGPITDKSLVTPNDFVSHMIEHIAWRLGRSVDVLWTSDDWQALGEAVGRQVAAIPRRRDTATALGMIDDGSAEVTVRAADAGALTMTATDEVDLDWFLGLRCEQLSNGAPLVAMLSGLCGGGGFDLDVTVASLEDPHHTWEGVYRAVGIALFRMCFDAADVEEREVVATIDATPASRGVERGWMVEKLSTTSARMVRRTAESHVEVDVVMGTPVAKCRFDVAETIFVNGMADLLTEFAEGANLTLDVSFLATRLSSSHVVAEDVGLAIGRALRGVAVERMEHVGINGAGSSVATVADLAVPVRTGISMEGRKFWKYVPFTESYADFRRSFLVGHTLPNGLFTEDLDDFVDGLAGGMHASVMVHFAEPVDPVRGWPMLFRSLGVSVAELLAPNPSRRGLIAGVKATLA